jgi:hypothetical protein
MKKVVVEHFWISYGMEERQREKFFAVECTM